MILRLRHLLGWIFSALGSRQDLILENLALRQQLLTKGQIFKHEVLTGLEGANRPAEKVPEPRDHGENIYETSPTELIPKRAEAQHFLSIGFHPAKDGANLPCALHSTRG